MLPLADTQFAEATWIMVVKSDRHLRRHLRRPAAADRRRAQADRPLPAPLRPQPGRPLRPPAAACRRRQARSPRRPSGPRTRSRTLFILGPLLPVLAGVLSLAIIPWGDVQDGVGLYGIDVPIGILYFFAVGSIAFYGLLLGGWSSGSKYSLLGAMRSAAQLISYEVSMGLALLGVVHDERLALAGLDRPLAGRDVVHRPPVRRLPDLHARRLRRDQPHPVRHARGRRRAGPGLHDRVRRHALRLLPAGRIHGDPRRLRDRRGDVPRRLDGPRPELPRPDLDAGEDARPRPRLHLGAGDAAASSI